MCTGLGEGDARGCYRARFLQILPQVPSFARQRNPALSVVRTSQVSELVWQIPLFALAGVAALRIAATPYHLWKEQKERADALSADAISPIKILGALWCESRQITGADSVENTYFLLRFFMMVTNTQRDVTLRNARATFHLFGIPEPLRARSAEGLSVDIQHGGLGLFELGETVYPAPLGDPVFEQVDMPPHFDIRNAQNGHLMFRVALHGDARPKQLAYPNDGQTPKMEFSVVVSADDVPSVLVGFEMQLQKLPDLKEAIKLEVKD